jgi:dethiobiotin synthetase/adenosylmethionine--8-amino-7-oxononanoate aminotransferase
MLVAAPEETDLLHVVCAACAISMLEEHTCIALLMLTNDRPRRCSCFCCLSILLISYCPSSSGLQQLYAQHITQQLEQHEASQGVRLGALLMEPLLQGAGGMLLADPLFQATLVQVGK